MAIPASGHIDVLKKSFQSRIALGNPAISAEFKLTIPEYPDLSVLATNISVPALKRAVVETFAGMGVKFIAQGGFDNAYESPVTFQEVEAGNLYKALKDWVGNKKYLDITVALVSEEHPDGIPDHTFVINECWLEMDPAELSVEDVTMAVKPAGTLHGSYFPETGAA